MKDNDIQLSLPPEKKHTKIKTIKKKKDYKGNLEHVEILHIILPYGMLNIMLYKAIELACAKIWRVGHIFHKSTTSVMKKIAYSVISRKDWNQS